MERKDHLNWAKSRALKYAENGDLVGAYSSFVSDLQKHPETVNHVALMLFTEMMSAGLMNSKEKVIDFINGVE